MQLRHSPRSRPADGASPDPWVYRVQRVGALAVAAVIGVFGVLGFAGGLDFFSTDGSPSSACPRTACCRPSRC
ncbi:hypothetical protein [Blastococcus brunescens]|uniref:Uncharacterized protein n=1 Tax=Blastococcus brunescens TaxID=1564165 RepID=A0ABZ1B140_9ACTN|nr:hypothetical protein [Blastococcus sp. BMG 8361]WRL64505.1 hypothetical protein U6N30_01305 [Blastococcus sp. BMG 8361]